MDEQHDDIQAMLNVKLATIDAIGQAIELLTPHAAIPNRAYDQLRDACVGLHAAKARIELELAQEKRALESLASTRASPASLYVNGVHFPPIE